MGAEIFITDVQEIVNVDKAFNQAIQSVGPTRGYSGTVAEKVEFEIVTSTPMSFVDAYDMADELVVDRTSKFSDKRSPAGALPVSLPIRKVVLAGLECDLVSRRSDWSKALEAPVIAALGDSLREGESINDIQVNGYTAENGKMKSVRATVSINKYSDARPCIDGWLFFGVSPY